MDTRGVQEQVSVVIACFNAARSISHCLQSVVSQRGVEIEIVVVDDGSSDDSAEISESFPNVRVIKQANRGACAARNNGLASSSGEFVKFLDADDFLQSGVLAHQVLLATKLASHQVTYGSYIMRDSRGDRVISTALLHGSTLFSLVLQDINTSTPLHRRHLLEKVLGFDTRLRRGQEWNLHVRLAASGVEFLHDPTAIYTYCNFGDPFRVSRYMSENIRAKHEYKITQIELTAEALRRNEYIFRGCATPAFARRLWSAGRDATREGHEEIAERCFHSALEFCSDTRGLLPMYYRVPFEMLGRKRLERLLSPRVIGRLLSRVERAMWRRL